MGDAVLASELPPGLDAYAGYVDGRWPSFAAIATRFPGAYLLPITVYLANVAVCLDIETGDATPDQAPQFVRERSTNGVYRPVLYASISVMPAVVDALARARLSRVAYRLWSAHYTYAHICGPTTCAYSGRATPACDGTQWTDHGTWDESLLSDAFFQVPVPQPSGDGMLSLMGACA